MKMKRLYVWKRFDAVFNVDEEEIEKTPEHIEWDANAAEKGGYEHFMLKEMYEQPKSNYRYLFSEESGTDRS